MRGLEASVKLIFHVFHHQFALALPMDANLLI
jgi:hypothetical protein